MRQLAAGRSRVALHRLRGGEGVALLALHEAGGSAQEWGEAAEAWPGPVFAVDLPGHGASPPLRGGAYTPENLVLAADAALLDLGEAAVVGRGLGAWLALLLAGARPERVPAAGLLPGRGFAGGGPGPDEALPGAVLRQRAEALLSAPLHIDGADPLVVSCERDPRPPDYARSFGAAARRLLLADPGAEPPPWWCAVRELSHAEAAPGGAAAMAAALARAALQAEER